jgi:hypothetical protein
VQPESHADARSPIKAGTRVRMTEAHKVALRGRCVPGMHRDPNGRFVCAGLCIFCSTGHEREFGACEGVVIGPCAGHDEPGLVDVRWEPSGLRYGYWIRDLEAIDT